MMQGDTHGNGPWVRAVIDHAKRQKADIIFQLGDFGIWGGKAGRRYVENVSDWATEAGVPFYFLDGNHENFDKLRLWTKDSEPDEHGMLEVLPNLLYSPRGNIFDMGGLKFMTMGGAVSVDKEWRIEQERRQNAPRTLWWDDEEITWADVESVPETKVDVLLSHDSIINPLGRTNYKWDAMSVSNREKLKRVYDKVRPDICFHGHFHYKHITHMFDSVIVGLECDEMRNDSCMFDTDTGKFWFI